MLLKALKVDRLLVWKGLLIGLLLIGLTFRFINLDRKVFWVDEVITVIRAAGYTKSEVTDILADGSLHTPQELLAYQKLTPNRSLADAVAAFQKSPEHTPLYFLLVRFWMQLFGNSVTAIRSFSVLCSLLLLPALYWLSQLLFGSARVSQIVVMLMAISPFFVAYAQEARPYSLWLLLLTLSSGALLRALERNTLSNWAVYALTLTLSLATSLLSFCVLLGQAVYVALHRRLQLRRFSLAALSATAAMLPWLWLIGQQWQTLQANTTWMRLPIEGFAKVTIWFYSVAILYFDVPVIFDPKWVAAGEIAVAAAVVAVIAYAFYKLYQSNYRLFVLSLSLPVPLTLILIDLFSGGRYSTAPRYMLPFHLGSQLAVAYLFSKKLQFDFNSAISARRWQRVFALIILLCLLSNLTQMGTSPKYLKNRSLHNFPIAAIINQADQPLLLAESFNMIDLISLSYLLEPEVKLQILPTAQLEQLIHQSFASENIAPVNNAANQRFCDNVFLFNPSAELQQQIQQDSPLQIEERYRPPVLTASEFILSVWQLKRPSC